MHKVVESVHYLTSKVTLMTTVDNVATFVQHTGIIHKRGSQFSGICTPLYVYKCPLLT